MERRLRLIAGAAVAASLLVTACDNAPGVPGLTPTPPDPHRVVLLGDSLIYGTGLPDADDFAAVISRDRPDLELIDAGVPGNRTEDAVARVRNVTDSHPGVVVIWLGTNDAITAVPVALYAEELSEILDRVAPARAVLVTPIDTRLAPGASRPYAAAVRTIAGQRGCSLVDLGPVVTLYDDLSDGVHLNAPAVVRVAHLIEQQLH